MSDSKELTEGKEDATVKVPIGKQWAADLHQQKVKELEVIKARQKKEMEQICKRAEHAVAVAMSNHQPTCYVNVKGFEPHSIHRCQLDMRQSMGLDAFQFADNTGFVFEHAVDVEPGREVAWMYLRPA